MRTNHADAGRVLVVDDSEEDQRLAVDSPDRIAARSAAPVRIAFDLDRPVIAPDALRRLEGVLGLRVEREHYTLLTRDGFTSTRSLMRLFDAAGVSPATLTIRRPTLEDAVVELDAAAVAAT